MDIYSQYNPPPSQPMDDWGHTKTRQSDKDSCDINNIVKRYKQGGILPAEHKKGFYADVSQMGDYKTALEQVTLANEVFLMLPSEIRLEFDNDPALFLDYATNPENKEHMQELGLMEIVAHEGTTKAPDGAKEEPKETPKD